MCGLFCHVNKPKSSDGLSDQDIAQITIPFVSRSVTTGSWALKIELLHFICGAVFYGYLFTALLDSF